MPVIHLLRRDLVLPAAVTAVVLALFVSGVFEPLELLSEDARFAYRGFVHQEDPSDVVVIGITHQSIEAIGELPWPRSVYAEAVDQLRELGAALICFDICFQADLTDEGDRRLVEAVAEAGNVVLPVFCPIALENYPAGPVVQVEAMRTNFPALTDSARALGHINAPPAADNKCRAIPFALEYDGTLYFSFGLECATRFIELAARREKGRPAETSRLKTRDIPLTDNGELLINYSGQHLSGDLFPFHELIDGNVPRDRIAGRVVLIGQTALGRVNADVVATPVGSMYGVLLQGTVIDSLLKGNFLTRQSLTSAILTVLACSLLAGLLFMRLNWWVGLTAWIGLVGVFCVASATLFDRAGYVIHIVPLLAALSGNYLCAAVVGLKRSRQRIDLQEAELVGILETGRASLESNLTKDTPQILVTLIGQTLGAQIVTLELIQQNRYWAWNAERTDKQAQHRLTVKQVREFEQNAAPKLHKPETAFVANALNKHPKAGIECNGVQSYLSTPLMMHNACIGQLRLYNKTCTEGAPRYGFSRDDIRLVSVLAQQSTLTISNLLLREDVEQKGKQIQQAADQLKQAQNELLRHEKLSTVGRMAAMIIHDIRSPMTALMGIGELFREQTLAPEETHEYGSIIVDQTERVNDMIQDLLDYTRGTTSLKMRQTSPADILKALEKRLELEFRQPSLQWYIKADCDTPVILDTNRMLRVLMNLCRNSATAMNNRGFIAIVCAERAGTVEFTVSDNGPGIPEDIRESVFEPFVTGGKGTGLGLAIAKRVVEEHEGTIRIDSRNGEGTTVTIAIPQEAAEETGEDS